MADEELQRAFEEEVAQSTIPTQVGDLNVDQLPGPEALYNPGLYWLCEMLKGGYSDSVQA